MDQWFIAAAVLPEDLVWFSEHRQAGQGVCLVSSGLISVFTYLTHTHRHTCTQINYTGVTMKGFK